MPSSVDPKVHIHQSADVSADAVIGAGTRIWHEAQVREGVHMGTNCIVGKGAYIDFGVCVGDSVKIQNRASVYHGTTIEDGVFIGPHVVFTNDMRPRAITPTGAPKTDDDWEVGETTVRYGASIGASSVILPGVVIGQFALVGAGSVVTKHVPDHAIVVGNPARVVGYACACAGKLTVAQSRATCPICGRGYRVEEIQAGQVTLTPEES